MNLVTLVCANCGKEFQGQKTYIRKGRSDRRYCSPSCVGKDNWSHAGFPCAPTDERHPKPPVKRGKDNPKYRAPAVRTCKYCGNEFEIKHWILNRVSNTGDFCSKVCRGAYRKDFESGENSPQWVGGILTYRGRGWVKAREKAVARDKGICQECGTVIGNSISVHHRRPFREFENPDDANALDNLICLCQPCHMRLEPRP